jgi:hypothetical protein
MRCELQLHAFWSSKVQFSDGVASSHRRPKGAIVYKPRARVPIAMSCSIIVGALSVMKRDLVCVCVC